MSAAYSANRSAVSRGPAAGCLARLRQVPVVERRDRLDPALAQALAQAHIEVDAGAVERAAAVGLHARPGDREAVGLGSQRRHQVEVLAPAVVVVARDVAGVAARDGAGPAEPVPDRRPAAVLVDRALDLVRRHRDAELEVRGERRAAGLRGWSSIGHPFTAPAVRPFTSQRCVAKNAMRTGARDTTLRPRARSFAGSCR